MEHAINKIKKYIYMYNLKNTYIHKLLKADPEKCCTANTSVFIET
jgi:hypothetical protein